MSCEETRRTFSTRKQAHAAVIRAQEMGFSITRGITPDRGNMPSNTDRATAFRPARFCLVEALDSLSGMRQKAENSISEF